MSYQMNAALSTGGDARSTYDETVQRAVDLLPFLRARAAEAEQLRRVPEASLEALHAAGLFRIVQPERFGGTALPVTIILDVCAQLAKACPSTAWVLGNLASHAMLLALWPLEAQVEVWGNSPNAQVGSSFVFPAGHAQRVSGGYKLSGRWPFSSGIHASEWVIVGGMVRGESESSPPEQRYFLLSREEYVVLDTWYVAGLRGTGSADLAVENVFVPEHRTLAYATMVQGEAPGLAIHQQPLFRFPLHMAGGFILVSTVYGAARGALEDLVASSKTRLGRMSGKPLAGELTLQLKIAEAAAILDVVELLTRTRLEYVMSSLEAHGSVPEREGVRMRRDSSFCARLCVQAIDIAFAAGGGSALYDTNPLQRAWRDVHAGAAHLGLQWDTMGSAYGRFELGLPSGLPGLSI